MEMKNETTYLRETVDLLIAGILALETRLVIAEEEIDFLKRRTEPKPIGTKVDLAGPLAYPVTRRAPLLREPSDADRQMVEAEQQRAEFEDVVMSLKGWRR